ncbi:TolC family outer membrane protein [Roseobacter sp. CCS2]|uniref:TolC family outer membrane protein n=1 Tax=Roseobacter sp. CCS2 TaxID=391593 RepID=UPI0000F403F2|nr:TolC family outer membrane protein [Roseobacter sp. CCS2]EBA13140.1 type I secretion outer membrane protein, TolC family, putative [Roseobacter sp. CCS2]
MIKRKGLAAIVIAMSFMGAPALKADTLADALSATYNNSGLLEQNRALLRAADEGVAQSVAATLPVINWSISADRTRSTSPMTGSMVTTDSVLARITGDLTLFDFGVNALGIDAQKEVVLGTRQALRGVEQDVLLRAVQAYMNVRSSNEFVQLRQNNMRLITQEFRAAQDRFEVGEVTRTDVALAEARLAGARSELASAQGDLAQAIEEYVVAVGRGPGGPRAVSPAPVSRSIADAKAFAVRNHPAILEAQHSVSAAELNIMRARAATRPRVSLNGFVSTDEDSNESAQLGVSIGGPIYQGGLLLSQLRQVQANRDQARSALHLTTLAVEQQVGVAFASLQVAQASRQASEQQIRAARVAFEGVREEATLGSRTTLDVLNAEQELLDAETNRIAAQSSEVIASYALLAAMGLLTVDHLNLPVQQYDPAEYYNLVKDAPSALSSQGAALDRVLEAIGKE